MTKRFKNLGRDERGVATIELALFAPILASMIIGVVDMSNAYSRKLACEQAAQRAIEKVMQTTGEDTPAQTIIDEAAEQAGISDEEKADKITVSYRLECDQVYIEDYDAACADGETESRYIEVEVDDVYQPMFPLHFASYDSDAGGYPITAKAGMRTQ